MIIGVIKGLSNQVEIFNVQFLIIGALGLVIGFGFWWIYFDFIKRRPFHSRIIITFAWSYLHMPLVMAYIAIGSGLLNVISDVGLLNEGSRILLSFSVGLALIFLGILETTLERKENEPTHPVFSPGLKIITGIMSMLIGLIFIQLTSIQLLSLLFCMQLINMIYGLYVWFIKEID